METQDLEQMSESPKISEEDQTPKRSRFQFGIIDLLGYTTFAALSMSTIKTVQILCGDQNSYPIAYSAAALWGCLGYWDIRFNESRITNLL